MFASKARLGDYLYLVEDNYQSVIEVNIMYINEIELFAAYTSLTLEDNIIMNDIIVSCHRTFAY
jgi:hypothetical protein